MALDEKLKEWRKNVNDAGRPADKPHGRCLLDFLDQTTPSGLLVLEKMLLDGCAKGDNVNASDSDKVHKKAVQSKRALPVQALDETGMLVRKSKLHTAVSDALNGNVSENTIRAGFLRFLILGGDAFAPVHEAGIQLWNARIDGDLELRSCKCVSRIALTNCILAGQLWMQDARLDVLLLTGSSVKGLHANRAKISGAMWLDENFYSDGEVELFGIDIGGRLDCSSGYFAAGIEAPGAVIGGDLNLSQATANATVSFTNADIGGSLIATGAVLTASDAEGLALDLSRTKIGGDLVFNGANMSANGWSDATDRKAINAQNIAVGGSVKFGGGFVSKGEVSFNGAAISKALDFAAGAFHNNAGYAIRAERSQVMGAIKFETTAPDTHWFESFGCVSLTGAQCGELNCNGGSFNSTNSGNGGPFKMALDCNVMNVSGLVSMCNAGTRKFHARGQVSFFTSHIGQHMYCGGGWFQNPGNVAMYSQAIKVDGCVFLGVAYDQSVLPDQLADLAFEADGKVDFTGAAVGLQFNCQSGRFSNISPDPLNSDYADVALNLSSARVGDTLFLGKEDFGSQPPAIAGSVDLTGATVRVLVDDGFAGDGPLGLLPTVGWQNAGGPAKTLRCILKLDQFSYDRLKGDRACKSDTRTAWLKRQPAQDLTAAFKPQPFEQLITVMRSMGYNDDADDIAKSKRVYERQAANARTRDEAKMSWAEFSDALLLAKLAGVAGAGWDLLVNFFELVFLDWFIGYGYRMSRAVILLFVFAACFALFYNAAFQQGAIVPVDKDIRTDKHAAGCVNWTITDCPLIAAEVAPRFNAWLYSADVIVPVIGFGQKTAWMPAGQANFIYAIQLVETILGWVEGFLLVSFVTGLIAKE